MKGICRLFEREENLQNSHIFPKFAINYTKNTGSKYMRSFLEPNRRMQDGLKNYLLSWEAEQLFSKSENWFAKNIFRPYLSGKIELKYNHNLYYFSVSFLWRILISELETTPNIKDKWYYDILKKVNKEWRMFLINKTIPNTYNQINILFTDRVDFHPPELKNVDFYMTRMMDGTIVSNPEQTSCFVYAKFNKFIFWGIIRNYGDESNLNSVKINPKDGVLKLPQNLEYFPMNSFLYNRIKIVGNLPVTTEEQQNKIGEEILKDKDFWSKDLGKSIINDMNFDDKKHNYR